MIEWAEIEIDILPLKHPNSLPHHHSGFVRVRHVPSGITVTSYYHSSQLQAKFSAMSELEELLELWEANHG